jgi:microcin C transport system ATP-binding protein
MQIVFQDPYGSLSPRMSIADIIAEGLSVHEPRLSRAARADRVAAALEEVGLSPDMAERYPHEFSGGQRQRVAIARAMILKPRLVVLDEPTSALDRSVQAQIVALLRRLQEQHGLGYLFISHDLAVVRALAHRVVVLRRGEVVEQGPAEDIFARPREAYTRALMAAAFDLVADKAGAVAC